MAETTRCPPRVRPTFENSPEIEKQVAATARVAPLFEAGLYKYVISRHYGLQRNENIKCNWIKFKQNITDRKREPFQFPNERDLHFYNCMIRFKPTETLYNRPSFRKSLKPGPGVDYGGQMPITQESLIYRKTTHKGKITKKMKKEEKDAKPETRG